jgi:hypothetical protein
MWLGPLFVKTTFHYSKEGKIPLITKMIVERFPRTEDKDILYLAKLRLKYPAPPWNWKYDGGYNPADYVVEFNLRQSKKKLRKLCRKHSLDPIGSKRKLVGRLYLHWRASKLKIGNPNYGYGPGYESTKTPDCVCGSKKKTDDEDFLRRKEELKEMKRSQLKEFMTIKTRRFPRYKEGRIHFPRL